MGAGVTTMFGPDMRTILYRFLIAVILLVIVQFYYGILEKPTIWKPPPPANKFPVGSLGQTLAAEEQKGSQELNLSLCVNRRRLIGPLQGNPSPPPLSQHPELKMGGYFVPNCKHSQSVAIIVPCHNRQTHLVYFIYHLHPFLQRQQLEYQIFVIDQVGDEIFNKASVMNVGALEALKIRNFSCFIFHDVDNIPENDENIYDCPPSHSARHLAVGVDKWNYTLLYETYFGGAIVLTREQFLAINGFSNRFYGWGGEDDDIKARVTFHGFKVIRPDARVARYKTLPHQVGNGKPFNPLRFKILANGNKYYATDGLSDLNKIVKEVQVTPYPLYTFITARIVKPKLSIRN